MSLTGVSPLIADWMRLGLKWQYHWNPVWRPFTIPAGGEAQVPFDDHIFSAPEGTLLTFAALFDDPACGLRLECYPELDTGTSFTVTAMMFLGAVNAPWFLFGSVPPQTAPGVYGVSNFKEWPWLEWLRLHVFNTDSVAHTCLGYAYTIATLLEPRPRESILDLDTLKRMQLVFEMYPEAREAMREKLAEQADIWLDEFKVKNVDLGKKVAG